MSNLIAANQRIGNSNRTRSSWKPPLEIRKGLSTMDRVTIGACTLVGGVASAVPGLGFAANFVGGLTSFSSPDGTDICGVTAFMNLGLCMALVAGAPLAVGIGGAAICGLAGAIGWNKMTTDEVTCPHNRKAEAIRKQQNKTEKSSLWNILK